MSNLRKNYLQSKKRLLSTRLERETESGWEIARGSRATSPADFRGVRNAASRATQSDLINEIAMGVAAKAFGTTRLGRWKKDSPLSAEVLRGGGMLVSRRRSRVYKRINERRKLAIEAARRMAIRSAVDAEDLRQETFQKIFKEIIEKGSVGIKTRRIDKWKIEGSSLEEYLRKYRTASTPRRKTRTKKMTKTRTENPESEILSVIEKTAQVEQTKNFAHYLSITVVENGKIVSLSPDGVRTEVADAPPAVTAKKGQVFKLRK